MTVREGFGWPRLMLLRTAMAYLDMGETAFLREVFTGNMPQPHHIGGKKRWDRHDIDAYLDRLSGAHYDWRDHQPGLQDSPPAPSGPASKRRKIGFQPNSASMQRARDHLLRAAEGKPPKR